MYIYILYASRRIIIPKQISQVEQSLWARRFFKSSRACGLA